ncbi:MAG TPA: hypothetical protein VEK37_15005, partial [Gemmatimonadaceae bacterium]|nr:hypothetical protein [Gemmatimonadaceae bacterium]
MNPTASKVAHALLECIGEVTTARFVHPLLRAIVFILRASVRVVNTESTKIIGVVDAASVVTLCK